MIFLCNAGSCVLDAGGGIIAPVLKDAENGEKYV